MRSLSKQVGGVLKRFEGDERVVLRRHDECRHADLARYAKRARLLVVLGGVSVTTRRGGHRFVPLPQAPDPWHRLDPVAFREQLDFFLERVSEPAKEILFVDEIPRQTAAIRARRQIDTGTDDPHRAKLPRRIRSKLPGHLQNQISADGVSCKERRTLFGRRTPRRA